MSTPRYVDHTVANNAAPIATVAASNAHRPNRQMFTEDAMPRTGL
jgi:hypothetical protein